MGKRFVEVAWLLFCSTLGLCNQFVGMRLLLESRCPNFLWGFVRSLLFERR